MSDKQQRWLLAGLVLGILLEGLDSMIVGTAMPRIISDLNGLALYSWVFTAYMLTSTVATPIYGKLSDLYGRKPIFGTGMGLFLVASVLAGQAQSMEWLVIWRGVQGLGAGALLPVAISIIGESFSGAQRAKIQGAISTVYGLTSLIGPTLGGWITDGPGWRWAFYISVPVGLVALAILFSLKLPRPAAEPGTIKIDYLGAATLTLFTTTLLLGFVFGSDQTLGWTSLQSLLLFGLALAGLIGFGLVEARAADPIIPLAFFKNPVFVAASLGVFLVGAAMQSAANFLSLYIQGVRGESATNSGTAFTPMMLALIFGGVAGGIIISKTGKYKLLALCSLSIMGLGIGQLVLLDRHSGTLQTLAAMITLGLGTGGTFPVFIIALQNAVEIRFLGIASSLNTFFRQIGATIAVSVMGSILTSQLASQVPQQLKANLPGPAYDALQASGFRPEVQILTSSQGLTGLRQTLGDETFFNEVVTGLREALANSLHLIFIAAFVLAIGALLVGFFLKEIPLRHKNNESGTLATPMQQSNGEKEAMAS